MDANREVNTSGPNAQPARAEISPEHFVPDHVFVYVTKGELRAYDGNKNYTLKADEYCLVRKNHLVRYDKENPEFERIVICFEEAFLKAFQEKHNIQVNYFNSDDAFISVPKNKIIPDFICSLKLYYDNLGKINEAFSAVKYEELLIILLQIQPKLAGILFTYSTPGKVNLEEFMNKNYIFNISVQRFAFLTGRSLSVFKRDFQKIFSKTPNRWLVQKRLQEAYFLIEKQNKKPTDIYLDLGFENLSHFSFAFRKLFGRTPTALAKK
ncbi:AraC family transcriptional regulator [Hymenobacter psoromatis]|uniref:AraC family transcriptional regulator n=1 Tax=Hymenobacter psoromatis TaxID=1484116 RepID=UPI001CBDEE35|nr:AraC family transcriptional regulator [Hymenobacter psoromatis]